MMFQAAAEAGEPAARLRACRETYDPLVLRKLGAKGGSSRLTSRWLTVGMKGQKKLGSTLAPERLERLARIPGHRRPLAPLFVP